jgi:hypothetical protein
MGIADLRPSSVGQDGVEALLTEDGTEDEFDLEMIRAQLAAVEMSASAESSPDAAAEVCMSVQQPSADTSTAAASKAEESEHDEQQQEQTDRDDGEDTEQGREDDEDAVEVEVDDTVSTTTTATTRRRRKQKNGPVDQNAIRNRVRAKFERRDARNKKYRRNETKSREKRKLKNAVRESAF